MEEEMRKIEEEFAFQEKRIQIFKRGKFILQKVSESLILKIITKIEAATFISFLQTCKWIFILCRENRGNIMIPLERIIKRDFYHNKMYRFKTSKESYKKYLPRFQMLLKSNFYFITDEFIYSNHLQRFSHYFQRQTIRCKKLYTKNGFYAPEAIHFFKPKTVHLEDLLKPLPNDFILPHFVKDFTTDFYRVDPEVLYSTLERFGWISASFMVQITETEQIDSGKFLPILLEVIKKRNAYNELTFLSYRDIENREFSLDYPCEEMFINSFSNRAIISQIFVKSILGVTIIMVKRRSRHNLCGSEFVSISFCENALDLKKLFNSSRYQNNIHGTIESEEEVDLKRREVISRFFYKGCEAEKEKDMCQQETDFSQVAHKFLKFEKYSPPTPDPTPEFVEFLKEFEDFDIQPEKLAPHKPKWKKTEKLPDLPRTLPEMHSNNWLIEAKEVIKLRKFWVDFLQKKKFILELLPHKNVLDIAKRIEATQFASLFTSCKWIHDLIQESHFRIHGGSWQITRQMFDLEEEVLELLRRKLDQIEFFYLRQISFNFFDRDEAMVFTKEIVTTIGEKKIFVKKIKLCFSPLIQEILSILKPIKMHFSGGLILADGLQFPPRLKHISVSDIKGSKMRELMASLIGLPIQVKWKVYDWSICETVIAYLQELKAKKSLNSNISIVIRSQLNDYKKECGELLSTDQNASETVYGFSSMVKDQWMYYIRLEKCGEYGGAVGVAFYEDYQSIANQKATIKCEYFPKMEDFLSYFEREIGSKRNAGQCRKKSKKEGFDNLISDAQKEEEKHFEEVRRRFFD